MTADDVFSKIKNYQESKQNEENILAELADSFTEEELKEIRNELFSPSLLLLGQSKDIDFTNYQGDLAKISKEVNFLYRRLNRYNAQSFGELISFLRSKDIYTILTIISYVPINRFLPNIIEILATLLENGSLESGTVKETEALFQSFKRIFDPEIQKVLFSLLIYQYHLDKELLKVKNVAWQLLNQNGRMAEAFLIQDQIQKAQIRIKKIKELFLQEKIDLNLSPKLNISLPLVIVKNSDPLFPIYKAFFKQNQKQILSLDKFFIIEYNLDVAPVKNLSQQLLIFKLGKYGEKIMTRLRSSGNIFNPRIVSAIINEILNDQSDPLKFLESNLREIVFAITDYALRKGWKISEVGSEIISEILKKSELSEISQLKLISYQLAREFIAGSVKIKYRSEEIISGMISGLMIFFAEKMNHEKYFSEILLKNSLFFFGAGVWDTSLELYPNIATAEKNIFLVKQSLKKELKERKIKEYQNLLPSIIQSNNSF